MGKYKWDVNYVYNSLDRLELVIIQLQPTIDEIGEKAGKLKGAKNLPQYVTQRVDNLSFTNKATIDRLLQGVRSVRSTLPQIERNHRHKLPRLRTGSQYRVMLGGAFLTQPVKTEYSNYYPIDKSKNLYLGDILTYQGYYKLDNGRDSDKPQDIFKIDGFIGALKPITENGRANLHYLAKTK